eukprot:3847013-Pyramimonas_sp.AAC.1
MRLRRTTAAPCFETARVAKRRANGWPSYWSMCSPRGCGNPRGNTWGKKRDRTMRRRKGGRAAEGTLLGLIKASWALNYVQYIQYWGLEVA